MTDYAFYSSKGYGLIRQPVVSGGWARPEIWRNGQWVVGSSYVMDAVTGMGEDAYSCGEMAFPIDRTKAEAIAVATGIVLDASRAD